MTKHFRRRTSSSSRKVLAHIIVGQRQVALRLVLAHRRLQERAVQSQFESRLPRSSGARNDERGGEDNE